MAQMGWIDKIFRAILAIRLPCAVCVPWDS